MASNQSRVTSSQRNNGISQDSIKDRAYEIWLEEGKPEGRDLEHWLKAEQELVHDAISDTDKVVASAKKATTRSSGKSKRLVSVN